MLLTYWVFGTKSILNNLLIILAEISNAYSVIVQFLLALFKDESLVKERVATIGTDFVKGAYSSRNYDSQTQANAPVCFGRACHAYFKILPDSSVSQNKVEEAI